MMTYNLSFDKKPNYLHAIVTGQNSRENVKDYMAEIIRECKATNCHRLLIEERLEGSRLDTMTVFQLVSEGSAHAIGLFAAIAYVDVNADGDMMEFAETVGVNRSIPVNIFSTVPDAEQWLSDLD